MSNEFKPGDEVRIICPGTPAHEVAGRLLKTEYNAAGELRFAAIEREPAIEWEGEGEGKKRVVRPRRIGVRPNGSLELERR